MFQFAHAALNIVLGFMPRNFGMICILYQGKTPEHVLRDFFFCGFEGL